MAGFILPGLDSSPKVEMLLSSIYCLKGGLGCRRRVMYWVGKTVEQTRMKQEGEENWEGVGKETRGEMSNNRSKKCQRGDGHTTVNTVTTE